MKTSAAFFLPTFLSKRNAVFASGCIQRSSAFGRDNFHEDNSSIQKRIFAALAVITLIVKVGNTLQMTKKCYLPRMNTPDSYQNHVKKGDAIEMGDLLARLEE